MENEQLEDINEVLPSDTNEQNIEKDNEKYNEQDLLKTELEKVQKKSRTQAEKLLYTKKRVEAQLKELGIEEDVETKDDSEDDKPMTIAMWKKLQAETATKTAIDLADEVENETERELLKFHLENTIKSTGDPQNDIKLARTLVNAVKNKQILEEVARKPQVKTHSSSSGVPASHQKAVELTKEEQLYMLPPWNLTKEQVLKARPK